MVVVYYWFCIAHGKKIYEKILQFLMTGKIRSKNIYCCEHHMNSKLSVYKQGFIETQKHSLI